MGSKTLSDQLQSSEVEAKEFLETFKNTYPAVRTYIESTIKHCRDKGYIETLGERRRYLPNITHQKSVVRSKLYKQNLWSYM